MSEVKLYKDVATGIEVHFDDGKCQLYRGIHEVDAKSANVAILQRFSKKNGEVLVIVHNEDTFELYLCEPSLEDLELFLREVRQMQGLIEFGLFSGL